MKENRSIIDILLLKKLHTLTYITISLIFLLSCNKYDNLVLDKPLEVNSEIQRVQTAFNVYVKNLAPIKNENFHRLGRAKSNRVIHWENAQIIEMNGKRKYRFPVSYPNQQTTIKDNLGKVHELKENSWLVVDSMHLKHPKFSLFTSLPEDNYIASQSKLFSGAIEITDWHGELEKAVIYKNGKIIGMTPRKSEMKHEKKELVMTLDTSPGQYICVPTGYYICIGTEHDAGHVCTLVENGLKCYLTRSTTDPNGWPIIDEDIQAPEYWYGGGNMQTPPDITLDINDECLKEALTEFLERGLVGDIRVQNMIKKFLNTDFYNINIKVGPTLNNQPADFQGTTWTHKETGIITKWDGEITLALDYKDFSKEAIVAIIIHEFVHAYTRSPGYQVSMAGKTAVEEHTYMWNHYISPMSNFLVDKYGLSKHDAISLCIYGLTDVPSFKNNNEFVFEGIMYEKSDLRASAFGYFARYENGNHYKGSKHCDTPPIITP